MTFNRENKENKLPLINEKIPGDKVQLIASSGENVGIVSKREAVKQAEAEGLDLVLIASDGGQGVPVAKIMDLGKAVYAKKKKTVEAKKKQKVIKVKELKIRPKIGDHDFQTKVNQALQFLEEGKRVKFTLVFRGREVVNRTELGTKLFQKFEDALAQAELLDKMVIEQDAKTNQLWSKLYYTK